jgi:hypothetical protein
VWKGLRNLRKTSFRMFGELVEIQTHHQQNESRQCYRLSYRARWVAHILYKPTGLLARGVWLNVRRWMFSMCREMFNISVSWNRQNIVSLITCCVFWCALLLSVNDTPFGVVVWFRPRPVHEGGTSSTQINNRFIEKTGGFGICF